VSHPGDLLSAYLDGEITAAVRAQIDAHLQSCGACRDEVAGLARARAAVRSLPMLDPPPVAAVATADPSARWWSRRTVAWAAAAAMAAVLGVGVLTGGSDAPPLDLDTLADHHSARMVVDPGIATIRAPAGGP
jgi:predicted anti-sigma-YlaC factor YlaD